MAQTHQDCDFDWGRLFQRADQAVKEKASQITAGSDEEPVLDQYDYAGLSVVRRPDDEQGIVRISLGCGTIGESRGLRYCVFRGSPEVCAALADEAAKAIRQEEG